MENLPFGRSPFSDTTRTLPALLTASSVAVLAVTHLAQHGSAGPSTLGTFEALPYAAVIAIGFASRFVDRRHEGATLLAMAATFLAGSAAAAIDAGVSHAASGSALEMAAVAFLLSILATGGALNVLAPTAGAHTPSPMQFRPRE